MFRDLLTARLAEMGGTPDYPRLASDVLGIRNASVELARRLVSLALVVEDRHETWRRVGARICRNAPSAPGVYVFRDTDGRALYVGKTVNLRRRLHAHFVDRRWKSLKPALARVSHVEWEAVASEILALLREAALIHELKPTVNVQISAPASRRRAVDIVLVVPSIDAEAAEIVSARADGRVLMQRARRSGATLAIDATHLWEFFQNEGSAAATDDPPLAPLVFSWLAGRGRTTTRFDPHDVTSSAGLHQRLDALLKDRHLFSERLVLTSP